MNAGAIIGVLGTVILVAILLGLLLSLPVMLLWNYCLQPAITGLNEITWLQAWGIMILCAILFKTDVSTK